MNNTKINPNCRNELPNCLECEYSLSCRQEVGSEFTIATYRTKASLIEKGPKLEVTSLFIEGVKQVDTIYVSDLPRFITAQRKFGMISYTYKVLN
jgi:hypothetical protein